MTEQAPDATVEALRAALERLRDHGYQPMYNGRPSCPFCHNFVDDEETHRSDCVLLAERTTRQVAAPEPDPYIRARRHDLGRLGHSRKRLRAAAQGPEQARDSDPKLERELERELAEDAAADARYERLQDEMDSAGYER